MNNNNQLLAALLRSPDSAGFNSERKDKKYPLLIVCHGFTGSKEGGGRAIEMGDELARFGVSTLLFDFAGCGESEGSWTDLTLTGQIDDLEAVVSWSRIKGFRSIVLTGRSFGGSTVLGYAARDREIGAFCTWAAVARPDLLFGRFLPGNFDGPAEEVLAIKGEEGVLKLKRRFFQDLRKHDLLSCASLITPRPLLIIHGTRDESVPFEEALLIYESAGKPKKLALIKKADHRFSNHIDEVWRIFFEWLKTRCCSD